MPNSWHSSLTFVSDLPIEAIANFRRRCGMNCSPATRQPGSSSLVCRGQEGTTFPLPRSLMRYCCVCSSPRACAGVRRWALHWSDADLTNGLLRVRGTLSRVNGHLVISKPKTLVSLRRSAHALTCPSPPRLWRSWVVKASQVGGRVKAASIWVETGLVFITESGTAVDPRKALRAISTAAKALGMSGVNLHTLRHSFGTHMPAAGVPLHTVSELL